MGSPFFFQFTLHALCEMAVAFAIAFWVSSSWAQSPAPFPANLVKNPLRPWLMVGFGIAPALLALLLNPLFKLFYTGGSAAAWVPISYCVSAIDGALVGLAASCCAAPADPRQEFRSGDAVAVTTVMIIASWLLSYFMITAQLQQFAAHELVAMVLPVIILFVARSIFLAGAQALRGDGVKPPALPAQRNLWPALVIGFLPAALLLATIAVASSANLDRDTSNMLLWLCSIASVVCCFVASIMLFKRHTGGAVAGGIVLLLLNGFIAFFFGCCASINGSNLH
jgi:hypothetical protein